MVTINFKQTNCLYQQQITNTLCQQNPCLKVTKIYIDDLEKRFFSIEKFKEEFNKFSKNIISVNEISLILTEGLYRSNYINILYDPISDDGSFFNQQLNEWITSFSEKYFTETGNISCETFKKIYYLIDNPYSDIEEKLYDYFKKEFNNINLTLIAEMSGCYIFKIVFTNKDDCALFRLKYK